MPNHIQNRLQIIGDKKEIEKLFNHIEGKFDDEKVQMDFNKIKPMPKGMDIEVHSGVKMWAEICTGQINFACLFSRMDKSAAEMLKDREYGSLSSRLAAGTAMEHLTGKREENVKNFSEDEFNVFVQCLKNFREHGATSWYEWSNTNWGTKWNAYGQNDKRNTSDTIYFQTAYSSPIGLIVELSKMFPLVKVVLTYADEDSGSNTGRIVLENGEAKEVSQPQSQSKEGYDIYFELHPEAINDYKMVDGKYEYIEE